MRLWTPSEDATLSEMWASNRVAIIADKLGRSSNSIIGRADRLRLPRIPRDVITARVQEGHASSLVSFRAGRNGGKIDPWRGAA